MITRFRNGGIVPMVRLFTGLIATFLFTCTGPLTGGNSSETTNVAIVTGDGHPAISASVKLIEGENWAYRTISSIVPVADSTTAGAGGIVSFSELPDERCNLQIDYEGYGIVIRDFCSKGKLTSGVDTIRLEKYATFSGSCSIDSGLPALAMLEGTAYTAPVANNRSFKFTAVAPGTYPIVFVATSGAVTLSGSIELTPDVAIARDSIPLSFSSLLIDNFENGTATSVLGQFTRASWYNYDDTADGGTSTVERTLKSGAPRGTYALSATMYLTMKAGGTWAGIGVPLGELKPDWDLSAMTGISFLARGRNTIRISLKSPLVGEINNKWPDFQKTIVLDSVWRLYRIPVDSLILPPSKALTQGVTWAMASKRIDRIEFEGVATTSAVVGVVDTIELQIDDLTLEGVSATELIRQMNMQALP
jgi:hypothetical protein